MTNKEKIALVNNMSDEDKVDIVDDLIKKNILMFKKLMTDHNNFENVTQLLDLAKQTPAPKEHTYSKAVAVEALIQMREKFE